MLVFLRLYTTNPVHVRHSSARLCDYGGDERQLRVTAELSTIRGVCEGQWRDIIISQYRLNLRSSNTSQDVHTGRLSKRACKRGVGKGGERALRGWPAIYIYTLTSTACRSLAAPYSGSVASNIQAVSVGPSISAPVAGDGRRIGRLHRPRSR